LAYTYQQILAAQYEVAQAENASANAALEDARLREDPHDTQAAVDRLIANNNVVQQLNQAAVALQQQQQAPMIDASFAGSDLKRHQIQIAQKFGLTGEEMAVAINATTDPSYDDAEKARKYAEGKERLRALRAGGYRDEADYQGRR
jgi:hypothetical protein